MEMNEELATETVEKIAQSRTYGDYHVHSMYSVDARGTVDEIVMTAKQKGLSEIAITDHGPASTVACRRKHYPHIRALVDKASEDHGIKVFMGIEANVLGRHGKIDIREEDLNKFDIVLCGIHRFLKPGSFWCFFTFLLPNWFWYMLHWCPKGRRRKNTETMKRVIEQNNIDIWTHPNEYFRLDVLEVAKVCVERGTLIELNDSRITFRPIDFERMRALGCKFVINSDAHRPKNIGRHENALKFLSLCEYTDEDIINFTGPFRRGDGKYLERVIETNEQEEQKPEKKSKAERKAEKKLAKEEAARMKIVMNKQD